MSDRKPFVGGNWKMNLNKAQAAELATALAQTITDDAVEVAVFPPAPYLCKVAGILDGTPVKVGAQNFYTQPNGAFTGEVSLDMVKDTGCQVVLVGHSERRHVLGETDTLVNAKVLAALDAGLDVVLAIGETLEQREAGQTDAINTAQTAYGLAGVGAEQMSRVTLAYEPVWAIGTGKTATPQDAQNAHAAIRAFVRFTYGDAVADAIRIQYGGSMKPGNAPDLMAQPDIDGGLIGGAALKADDFAGILHAATAPA